MSHRNRGRRASAAVLAGLIASTSIAARAQTAPSPTKAISPAAQISIGAADIGGVVASAHGPEAGVWVIAETTDLPTKFAKIVVTDDAGRYLRRRLHNGTIGKLASSSRASPARELL